VTSDGRLAAMPVIYFSSIRHWLRISQFPWKRLFSLPSFFFLPPFFPFYFDISDRPLVRAVYLSRATLALTGLYYTLYYADGKSLLLLFHPRSLHSPPPPPPTPASPGRHPIHFIRPNTFGSSSPSSDILVPSRFV
jgi:hypothetical protein